MKDKTPSDKRIKMNVKCPYCEKEIWLGERVVHGEHKPFHFDCFIQNLRKEMCKYVICKEGYKCHNCKIIDKYAGDALIHSQHNTIAESDRTDLLDSGLEVGEQVGSVGRQKSLKAPRNKSRRVAGSEDAGTHGSAGKEIKKLMNNLEAGSGKTECAKSKEGCPFTEKEGYVAEEECHCFCCGVHGGRK